ncbi:MAG: hypothetical protein ACK4FW_09145, partial [Stenotrophomonas sp.]
SAAVLLQRYEQFQRRPGPRVPALAESKRSALHALKHRGLADSENKASGGHKSGPMRQFYDQDVLLAKPRPKCWIFPAIFPEPQKRRPAGA